MEEFEKAKGGISVDDLESLESLGILKSDEPPKTKAKEAKVVEDVEE